MTLDDELRQGRVELSDIRAERPPVGALIRAHRRRRVLQSVGVVTVIALAIFVALLVRPGGTRGQQVTSRSGRPTDGHLTAPPPSTNAVPTTAPPTTDVSPRPPRFAAVPSRELGNGQQIAVHAAGLRPNSSWRIQECRADGNRECDQSASVTALSATDGRINTRIAIQAAIYGDNGRTDCTTTVCVVRISNPGSASIAEAPIRFARSVVAPVPALSLDPPGPYTDGQTVKVNGTGFPPGRDIGTQIGQCPADLDTAIVERCNYNPRSPSVVDPEGRFTLKFRLHSALAPTGPSCEKAPGCILGWVPPHLSTVAKTPLSFKP